MKKIALIILVAVLFLASVSIVYATLGNKTITITYRNISIYINGVKKVPSNEPFIYNSSTYVPLRFVSEALDKEVKWDGTNNRIDINDKSTSSGEWKKVIEFTGAGISNTKPFTIHSKTWKIVYSAQETLAGYGMFTFDIEPVDDPSDYVGSIMGAFKNGSLSSETYIYEGNRTYYLSIISSSCDYIITVYEQ